MDKYLFLDIDGVIAVPCESNDFLWGISNEKQQLLKKIFDAVPDLKIVLSSSWRKFNLEATKNHMDEMGFWFTDKIVGITIRAYHYLDRSSRIHLSIPRGVEINQWLDTNIHSNNGKDFVRLFPGEHFQYCILDDDGDMLLNQKDHFVQTNAYIGITEKEVELVINIFKPKTN